MADVFMFNDLIRHFFSRGFFNFTETKLHYENRGELNGF